MSAENYNSNANRCARNRTTRCSVPMCKKNPNHSSFRLPKDPHLASQWLSRLGINHKPMHRVYVCEAHFDESCFHEYINQSKHLIRGSLPLPQWVTHTTDQPESKIGYGVPDQSHSRISYTDFVADIIVNSLNTPPPLLNVSTSLNPEIVVESSSSMSSVKTEDADAYESQQHNVDELKVERIEGPPPTKADEFNVERIEGVTVTDTDPAVQIILELQKKIGALAIVPEALQQLALKIHLTWPHAYEMSRKTLHLPSVSELKSIFDDYPVLTDNNTLFVNTLRYKVSIMTERQKQCFVYLGEVEVKEHLYYDLKLDKLLGIVDINDSQRPEPASKVLILTVEGLFEDWKQPAAIAYLGKQIDKLIIYEWISRNIQHLLDIGLSMKAIVYKTDLYHPMVQSYNMNLVYDVPSLFVLFYHNFLTHEYVFNGGIAKMQHIIDYYELDRKRQIRLSPKLTARHVNTNRLQDINIQLVTDVINTNTAAAMSTYVHFQALHQSAMYTVQLITEMNALYEVLCDNTCNEIIKVAPREKHIQFLNKMLLFFEHFKIIHSHTNTEVPKPETFVAKIQTTIRSILNLYQSSIKFNSGSEILPVRRFRLENIEKIIDRAKMLGKKNQKPTCKEIHSAFRQSTLLNILRSNNKDRCLDLKKALDQIDGVVSDFKNPWQKVPIANIGAHIKIKSSEYSTLDLKKKDAVVLIAGFLLKKCQDYHSDCVAMKNYICIVLHDTSSICKTILNEIQEGVCVVPQESFIEFVEMMEIRFRSFMTKSTLETQKGKLMNGLLMAMQLITFPMPCECFPILYAKKLYSRLRIYNMLKHNNSLLSFGQCKTGLLVNNL